MARVFNGSSQYLSNTSFATGSFPITLSAWIYTSNASQKARVATWVNAGGDVIATIFLNEAGTDRLYSQVYNSGGFNSFAFMSGLLANTWQHLAVVVTSTGHTPYIDGVAGTTVIYSTPTMLNMTRLHVGNYPGVQFFNGRIAYPSAYSAALTADEIADLGRKLNGEPCGVHPIRIRPESIVACWPLGGFHGDDDRDVFGAYDLTAYGSPTFDESPAVIYPSNALITDLGQVGGGGGGGSGIVSRVMQQHGVVLGA